MGLAASQARYLALTARKSDLEFQSQTINSRRIQLSYKTAAIAQEYTEGMNNTTLQIKTTDQDNKSVWEKATFSNIFDATTQTGYMVIGINGAALNPSPYIEDGTVTEKTYKAIDSTTTYTSAVRDGIVNNETAADGTTELTEAQKQNSDGEVAATTANEKIFTKTASSTDSNTTYTLTSSTLSEKEYNALSAYAKTLFTEADTTETTKWKVNPDYEISGGKDLETLLSSASAQIVTKGFFNFLVSRGYSYNNGMSLADYQQAVQDWNNNKDECNTTEERGVVDWQADETNTFQQRSYTEDDDAVLAKYTAETAKIEAQDKMLEMQEKNIETQHKAIETELESIQKVIQNNIEKTFKIFS